MFWLDLSTRPLLLQIRFKLVSQTWSSGLIYVKLYYLFSAYSVISQTTEYSFWSWTLKKLISLCLNVIKYTFKHFSFVSTYLSFLKSGNNLNLFFLLHHHTSVSIVCWCFSSLPVFWRPPSHFGSVIGLSGKVTNPIRFRFHLTAEQLCSLFTHWCCGFGVLVLIFRLFFSGTLSRISSRMLFGTFIIYS